MITLQRTARPVSNGERRWSEADIPDQQGKLAIVTGANSGIGLETATVLAQRGACVVLACRDLDRARAVADQIVSANDAVGARRSLDLKPAAINLADLDSVRRFADDVRSVHSAIHVLVNNAGVMMPPYARTTQGFELQLGVNHLAHFALTALLLPNVLHTSGSRVVTVSSYGHRFGRINFGDLQSTRTYRPSAAYGQSKLANLLFAYELQRRLQAAGHDAISVACHPGRSRTQLQRHAWMLRLLRGLFSQPARQGAWPTLYAATSGEVEGGDYIGPDGWKGLTGYPVRTRSSDASYDTETAGRLWQISEQLTDCRYALEKVA